MPLRKLPRRSWSWNWTWHLEEWLNSCSTEHGYSRTFEAWLSVLEHLHMETDTTISTKSTQSFVSSLTYFLGWHHWRLMVAKGGGRLSFRSHSGAVHQSLPKPWPKCCLVQGVPWLWRGSGSFERVRILWGNSRAPQRNHQPFISGLSSWKYWLLGCIVDCWELLARHKRWLEWRNRRRFVWFGWRSWGHGKSLVSEIKKDQSITLLVDTDVVLCLPWLKGHIILPASSGRRVCYRPLFFFYMLTWAQYWWCVVYLKAEPYAPLYRVWFMGRMGRLRRSKPIRELDWQVTSSFRQVETPGKFVLGIFRTLYQGWIAATPQVVPEARRWPWRIWKDRQHRDHLPGFRWGIWL